MSPRFVQTGLVAAAFALAAPLQAAWTAAEGAELFLTADVAVERNDNIFLSNAGTRSDTIVELSPGLLFTFGENAIDSGTIGFREDFRLYGSNSSLDAALARAWANIERNTGKTVVKGGVTFQQMNQANVDVRGVGFLVRRDLFHFGLDTAVDVTEKSLVSVGIAYDNTEYKRAGYSDWKWWEIPVKYYYKTWPKLELGAGYTYRVNELAAVLSDSTEHFYNFRARGEVTPKLTGEIAAGLLQNRREVGGTQNSLGLDAQFTYTATEKALITIGASNAFGYSGTASSYRKLSLNASTDLTFTPAFRAGGGISYGRYNYGTSGQTDDFYSGNVHGSYLINAFLAIDGSYTYTRNDSNLAGAGFTNNQFRIGASLKY